MFLLKFSWTQAVETMISQNVEIKSRYIIDKAHTTHENMNCSSEENYMFKKFRNSIPKCSRSFMIQVSMPRTIISLYYFLKILHTHPQRRNY